MNVRYKVLRSDRRSVKISIKDGEVIVNAPCAISDERIQELLRKHAAWIDSAIKRERDKAERFGGLSQSQILLLKKSAREYLSTEVERYSKIMGVKCGRIKITSAEKRFGSCNSKGTICFSYRLMMYPEEAREYVVVHELAHLIEMNHSRRFYEIIERVMPDYKYRKSLLSK